MVEIAGNADAAYANPPAIAAVPVSQHALPAGNSAALGRRSRRAMPPAGVKIHAVSHWLSLPSSPSRLRVAAEIIRERLHRLHGRVRLLQNLLRIALEYGNPRRSLWFTPCSVVLALCSVAASSVSVCCICLPPSVPLAVASSLLRLSPICWNGTLSSLAEISATLASSAYPARRAATAAPERRLHVCTGTGPAPGTMVRSIIFCPVASCSPCPVPRACRGRRSAGTPPAHPPGFATC